MSNGESGGEAGAVPAAVISLKPLHRSLPNPKGREDAERMEKARRPAIFDECFRE